MNFVEACTAWDRFARSKPRSGGEKIAASFVEETDALAAQIGMNGNNFRQRLFHFRRHGLSWEQILTKVQGRIYKESE